MSDTVHRKRVSKKRWQKETSTLWGRLRVYSVSSQGSSAFLYLQDTPRKKKKKDLFPKMLPLLKIGETEEMALVSSNERNSKT